MERKREGAEGGFSEVLAALSLIDSSTMTDILLGPVEDVPMKFYDPELGSI